MHNSRNLYLLPNLFTTAGLFCGFYAIIAALHSLFEQAAIAIFTAMVLDSLDGRVARMTHTESRFGAEYDSMADLISFGLAPAIITYEWILNTTQNVELFQSKIAWLAAFFYTVMTALRLARFNIQLGNTDKRYFLGLPSPSAAAITTGFIWCNLETKIDEYSIWLALLLTITVSVLMCSNILYISFKNINLHGRVPFINALLVVITLVFISINPPKILFFGFFVYSLSGPLLFILRWIQRIRRRNS